MAGTRDSREAGRELRQVSEILWHRLTAGKLPPRSPEQTLDLWEAYRLLSTRRKRLYATDG
eukprot:6804655-Prymnesium_polylepis.1